MPCIVSMGYRGKKSGWFQSCFEWQYLTLMHVPVECTFIERLIHHLHRDSRQIMLKLLKFEIAYFLKSLFLKFLLFLPNHCMFGLTGCRIHLMYSSLPFEKVVPSLSMVKFVYRLSNPETFPNLWSCQYKCPHCSSFPNSVLKEPSSL